MNKFIFTYRAIFFEVSGTGPPTTVDAVGTWETEVPVLDSPGRLS